MHSWSYGRLLQNSPVLCSDNPTSHGPRLWLAASQRYDGAVNTMFSKTETWGRGQERFHDDGAHSHSCVCQNVPTRLSEQAGLYHQSHYVHQRCNITDGRGAISTPLSMYKRKITYKSNFLLEKKKPHLPLTSDNQFGAWENIWKSCLK
jgi:hypothetical protein